MPTTSYVKTVCLCNDCAVGVANDDWTSIDYHFGVDTPEANREHARIMEKLKGLGWLSYFGPANAPDSFYCDLCDETQCDGGTLFATE